MMQSGQKRQLESLLSAVKEMQAGVRGDLP